MQEEEAPCTRSYKNVPLGTGVKNVAPGKGLKRKLAHSNPQKVHSQELKFNSHLYIYIYILLRFQSFS